MPINPVKSYYLEWWYHDGSVFPATGQKIMRSSRMSTREMVEEFAYAVIKGGMEYAIQESELPPEITPTGPYVPA